MQQFTRGYELWNTLKRSLSLPYSFRVEQWIDRSDTGKMVCYFGVAISIQVGSNFKFEFVFYEKLYIYIYVCNSVIIDDLRWCFPAQDFSEPSVSSPGKKAFSIGWNRLVRGSIEGPTLPNWYPKNMGMIDLSDA